MAEITGTARERDEALGYLEDLLAVIHRDGGHHTGEVGLDASVKDGMRLSSERIVATHAKVAPLMAERDALKTALLDIMHARKYGNSKDVATATEEAERVIFSEVR
jgi:hypothetical protein